MPKSEDAAYAVSSFRQRFDRRGLRLTATMGLLACVVATHATDYYVRPAPAGNDNGPGTAAQPFATVTHGVYQLAAGDTLYIGDGTYYEGELYPETDATPAQPITIRNIPGETPILDGGMTRWNFIELIEQDGYIIAGLTLRHYYDIAISCVNSGHVAIRDCICHGNGSAGIGMNYADYPHATYDAHMLIEDNVCYENGWGIGWASGIHVNNKNEGGDDSAHIIRRNVCYNNFDGSAYHTDGNGIMFDIGGGGTCLIENNLCFNNGGAGIRAMDGRATIINNTCFRNGWDTNNDYQPPEIELIERHLSGAVGGSAVRNNVIWARPKREFGGAYYGGVFRAEDVPLSDFVFENNVLWSDAPDEVTIEPWMLTCIKAAADFCAGTIDDDLTTLYGATFLDMNVTDYDFHLLSTSPAIDAGLPTSAPDHDIEHTPRPWSIAWDAGAHEYVANGDCDANGHVDLTDCAHFATCCVGPDVSRAVGCACVDLDGDGDVDTIDVATLQQHFGQ